MREYEKSFGEELESRQYKQTGEIAIPAVEFVEYKGDPLAKEFEGHEIQLSACSDLTQVDYVDPDGKSHFSEDDARRLLMDVTMRADAIKVNGQPKIVWSVSAYDKTTEEC